MNRLNRTTLTLIAAVVALLAVTGFAALTAPDGSGTDEGTAERRPVERSTLLCPEPSTSDLAETEYVSYTPGAKPSGAVKAAETSGSAELHPAANAPGDGSGEGGEGGDDDSDSGDGTAGDGTGGGDDGKGGKGGKGSADTKPLLTAKAPGKPVTADAADSGAGAPALLGAANGALAPGWTVQQTTSVAAGEQRGLYGIGCSAPDTDFWFPGAGTADTRSDYIHLTNPDDSAAVVDLKLYGKNGAVASEVAEGIQVRPHETVPVLLSTLTEKPETNLTVHVTARTGRVAAALQSTDQDQGGDWMPASAAPTGSVVLPGIPKDAEAVRLVAFTPGQDDADLKVRLLTPTGAITPAGHETLHVKSGMTAAVDLGDLTRGEPGSLLLTPTDESDQADGPAPVVAGLRVVRGKGDDRETAFIPATPAVGERATAADNRAKGSTLSLVAPGKAAKVRITSSAGSEGGKPASKTYTVKAGTTLTVTPPVPGGLKSGGRYAVTVETLSGGPVHASRMLETPKYGIPMFTVQPMPYDQGTVRVPKADQDLSVLEQ